MRSRQPLELRVRRYSSAPTAEGCVLWLGHLDADGYGKINVDRQPRGAHRVVYEMARGPIPAGLVLDHLCRNPSCINPEHLEPVTQRENVLRSRSHIAENARKRSCKHGHPFDAANTYWHRGQRRCRACNLAAVTRRKARLLAA